MADKARIHKPTAPSSEKYLVKETNPSLPEQQSEDADLQHLSDVSSIRNLEFSDETPMDVAMDIALGCEDEAWERRKERKKRAA